VSLDGWITFTDPEGQRHRWWHHDAGRMIAAARTGSTFVRIGNSMFLTAPSPSDPTGWVWFDCAVAPTHCRRN
jgi:YD repeat-containing protein